MKIRNYCPKTGFVATLTDDQKNTIKSLYLEKKLSMSQVSRQSGISLGLVQRFLQKEGLSRDRIRALKGFHKNGGKERVELIKQHFEIKKRAEETSDDN